MILYSVLFLIALSSKLVTCVLCRLKKEDFNELKTDQNDLKLDDTYRFKLFNESLPKY
jgi:hypothetical protein